MKDELPVVARTRVVPEHALEAGDVGTIVLVHEAADQPGMSGYTVEFMDFLGATIAIADLPADAVRRVRDREIAHVRQVA
ncbi:MAG: DUF4926 domain-containing protein [Hyphomicrobiaceae bacterium]|nr:DUF4926 domain-containing protein [Hyphomicrobiaceae bacterium]